MTIVDQLQESLCDFIAEVGRKPDYLLLDRSTYALLFALRNEIGCTTVIEPRVSKITQVMGAKIIVTGPEPMCRWVTDDPFFEATR